MLFSRTVKFSFFLLAASQILACGGGGGSAGSPPAPVTLPPSPPPPPAVTTDTQLRDLIAANGLTGDPTIGRTLPSINDPLAQLGKLLFFSKSLSGDLDVACASCHHPALGGADGLSLPVGTGAIDPDLVGPGRERPDGLPNVGRHSQTVFNVALYDSGLFWDSRVESISKEAGQNGAQSGIDTPDTAFGVADAGLAAGTTLPDAQARFPVTVPEEMLGSFLPGADSQSIRSRLAERIGDYGAGQGELAANNWLAEFQAAFASALPADQLVTFDNIALAIAEYQRSMIFVDTPWKAYVDGDNSAISGDAKQGALLFFRDTSNGGFDCVKCHSGDFFTNEEQTVTGFPQLGPGKGDGGSGDEDFGREQLSAATSDRFRLRTPSLLNLGATAPYTHSGVYDTLLDATGHYFIPDVIFDDFMSRGGTCSLEQFSAHPQCATIFANLVANSEAAFDAVIQARTADPDATFEDASTTPLSNAPLMLAFLATLTDPCTLDRSCVTPWIPLPGDAPDDHQLNAIDLNGAPL
ncbi:MAG: cytochrome-c peroxidase [Woeseiaceae bacterium]